MSNGLSQKERHTPAALLVECHLERTTDRVTARVMEASEEDCSLNVSVRGYL